MTTPNDLLAEVTGFIDHMYNLGQTMLADELQAIVSRHTDFMSKSELTRALWRVGIKVPINVYEGDRPVCQCQTASDAKRIVDAVNTDSMRGEPRKMDSKCPMCSKGSKAVLRAIHKGSLQTSYQHMHGDGTWSPCHAPAVPEPEDVEGLAISLMPPKNCNSCNGIMYRQPSGALRCASCGARWFPLSVEQITAKLREFLVGHDEKIENECIDEYVAGLPAHDALLVAATVRMASEIVKAVSAHNAIAKHWDELRNATTEIMALTPASVLADVAEREQVMACGHTKACWVSAEKKAATITMCTAEATRPDRDMFITGHCTACEREQAARAGKE